VPCSVQLDESEVTAGLDVTNLLVIGRELKLLEFSGSIILLSRPFESLGPRFVTKPVADVVGITLNHR
jgi:hypothetical protein